MTRSEMVERLRGYFVCDPEDAADLDSTLRALADENHTWTHEDAREAWSFIAGCWECDAEISVPRLVMDAVRETEAIVRREFERLGIPVEN